jgi:hypothetical protein
MRYLIFSLPSALCPMLNHSRPIGVTFAFRTTGKTYIKKNIKNMRRLLDGF